MSNPSETGNTVVACSGGVLVVYDAAIGDAIRDGVPPADWLACRCRGCDARLLLPARDLASLLGGGDWPAGVECVTCHRDREERESREERDLLRTVTYVTAEWMRTSDEGDKLQIAMLAAVPTLLHYYGREARELFAAAGRIAGDWSLSAGVLLRVATYAVEQGYTVDDLIKIALGRTDAERRPAED
jgi:hypothetical protein